VFRPHNQLFILQNIFVFFSLSTAAVATDFCIRILYLPEVFRFQFNFPYFIGASRNADLQFLSSPCNFRDYFLTLYEDVALKY
jgi:hypothetical protein